MNPNYHIKLAITLGVLTIFGIFSNAVIANEELIINTAFWEPISTQEQNGFFDQIMQEALGRLGKSVIVRRPPAERGLINANEGIDDGDGPRIANLKENNSYKNMIIVPEKIIDVDFVAFYINDSINVNNWKDLGQYNVGIVTGWKILERETSKYKTLTRVKNPYLLFNLLKIKRIDVAIIDSWTGDRIIEKINLQGHVNDNKPVLAHREMYLFMHKKHKVTAQDLAVILQEMKKDGTYIRIYNETLK